MNLIIDLGNSLSKIAIFENSTITQTKNVPTDKEFSDIDKEWLKTLTGEINNVIVSSVVGYENNRITTLKNMFSNILLLNHETKIPIRNLYQTKQTLGYDRIAAAVGANAIFPNTNVLVIDIGTAITFDMVNEHNEFLGGNISPGMAIRYKALHQFTKKLPQLSKNEDFNLIGKNTTEAITNGVQNGIIFEIDGYINQFSLLFNNLKVILTGGDTFFFAKKLKNTIFAEQNLLFLGLNRILDYNVKN